MKNQKKVFQSGFTNIYKMAKKIYGLGRKDRKK